MPPPDPERRPKVLIIAQIAPRRIGSYERYHFGVAHALNDRGWAVHSAFSAAMTDPVRDHFGLDHADYTVNLGDATDRCSRRAWINLLREARPTLVWVHFFPTMGLFSYQLRRALPDAWIVETDHISRGKVTRGPIREVAHRLRLKLAQNWLDAHVGVSRFVADRLVTSDRIKPAKVHVIYNGIDLNSFDMTARAEQSYLITVCYMRPEKGVGILLEALVILKRAGIEPRYLLVGDGPELDGYRCYARDHGLARVEFLGLRNDVPDLLRHAMLSVVPSVWPEAFSYAAAESQALGVPVIASTIGGLKEVVEDGVTGLHVPPSDPKALAASIRRLIDDPATRAEMGRAGRLRVERLFNLEDKIRETVSLFEQMKCPRPAGNGALEV